ncbi:mucin-19 [Galendromus occidentalis]|uniref:Mucin-19 n=1 Tax=Galendromus occidentalis TaxID=34638 RepID=A0AAJ7SF52_9ACAR|nr:mucin-19 [Galendromus occidentalis]
MGDAQSASRGSPFGRGGCLTAIIVLVYSAMLIAYVDAAPAKDKKPRSPRSELGCSYNFTHYDNGASIQTQEPCLNCTCQDSMLLCYLNVCPYVKALGEECTVTKKPGQCCPEVHCPSGCYIDNKFYNEGQRLPMDPLNPCETCYCVRNSSSCVLQDCVLHIDGCSPVFHKKRPTCCPARYDCCECTPERQKSASEPLGETDASKFQRLDGCDHEGRIYAIGDSVPSADKCQNCYCMPNNTVICQSQECQTPPGCTAGELAEGECCPTKFDCPSATTLLPDQDLATTVMPEEGRADSTESVELSSEASATAVHKYSEVTTESQAETTPQSSSEQPRLSTTVAPPTSRGEQARADDCEIEGVAYKLGEKIIMKDPCLANCTCGAEGLVQCDHITCHEPEQDISECKVVKEEGMCCPYYDCPHDETTPVPGPGECIIDGVRYAHNTTVPQDDVCRQCLCLNSELICAVEECVEGDGCILLPPTKDICCNYKCDDDEETTDATQSPQDLIASTEGTTFAPGLEPKKSDVETTPAAEVSTESSTSVVTEAVSEMSSTTEAATQASEETSSTAGSTTTGASSESPSTTEASTPESTEGGSTESAAGSSTEASTEAATEESTSAPPSTEASSESAPEASTPASTEASTAAATSEPSSEAAPSAATEQSTEAATEPSTSEGSTDSSSIAPTESSTETSSEASSSATAESSTEKSSEAPTEVPSEASSTEADASSAAPTEESSTEGTTPGSTGASSEASSETTSETSSSSESPSTESAATSSEAAATESTTEVPSESPSTDISSTESGTSSAPEAASASTETASTEASTEGAPTEASTEGASTETVTQESTTGSADEKSATEGSTSAADSTTSASEDSSQDCVYDGMTYPNNSEIPSDDACRLCKCISGEVTCATEICEEPDEGCELMPATKAECCNYKCADDQISSEKPGIESKSSQTEKPSEQTTEAPEAAPESSSEGSTEATSETTTGLASTEASSESTPESSDAQTDSTASTEGSTEPSTEAISSSTSSEPSTEVALDGTSSPERATTAATEESTICVIDGKTFAHKESIPNDNPCRICECISGEMTCADEICDEPEDGCELQPATKDECCVYKCQDEEQSTTEAGIESKSKVSGTPSTDLTTEAEQSTQASTKCMVDGKTYPLGGEVPSDNPCRICQCTAEGMVCADEVCEDPEDGCVLQPPTADECCNYKCEEAIQTEKPGIESKSKPKEEATEAAPPSDASTESTTAAAEAATTTAAPEDATDAQTSAAPSSSSCTVNGEVYEHNTTVKHEDPCQLCMCIDAEVICSTEICPEPEPGCTQMAKNATECCVFECTATTTPAATTPENEPSREDVSSVGPSTTEEIFETTTGAEATTPVDVSSETPEEMSTALPTVLPTTTAPENVTDSEETEEEVTIGPGECVYEGRVYQSAAQIPRPDPCDFCFCFRSDIICLQQTCPPPIAGCHETAINGYCCPRYECHVNMAYRNTTNDAVTTTTTTTTTSTTPEPHSRNIPLFPGCQVKGAFYRIGELITAVSTPCMECRCDETGSMKCDPKDCQQNAPLLLRMNRSFFRSSS